MKLIITYKKAVGRRKTKEFKKLFILLKFFLKKPILTAVKLNLMAGDFKAIFCRQL
jgi:hypothetical protein